MSGRAKSDYVVVGFDIEDREKDVGPVKYLGLRYTLRIGKF